MKKLNILKSLVVLPLLGGTTLPLVLTSCGNNKITITFTAGVGGTIEGSTSIKVAPKTKWSDITNKPTASPSANYEFDNWFIGTEKVTNDTIFEKSTVISAQFMLKVVPAVDSFETILANTYSYSTSSSAYVNASPLLGTYNIYKINGSSVGYVEAEWFFHRWGGTFKVETDTTNHITTITNKANDSTCVIDFRRQTISYEDYESFKDYSGDGPMLGGCGGGWNYYKNVTTKTYKAGSAKVMDLKKYKIVVYEKDGKCYMPYEFYKNFFEIYICQDKGYAVDLDWNGTGLYQIVPGINNLKYSPAKHVTESKKLEKAAAPDGFYNADYMEYCYNLLALTLDTRFGLRERVRRNTGKTYQYMPNGALEALKPYHDDLVSTDNDKSSKALRNFFKECLDDAGHTAYTNLNVLSTEEVKYRNEVFGEEYLSSYAISSGMDAERNKTDIMKNTGTLENPVYVIEDGYREYTSAEAGKGTIAYITFDSFDSESGLTTEEKAAGEATENPRELAEYTTKDNYMNDTLRLTMYANKMIKQNNIKNVVVDLSCNGGGVVYTEHFLASWLCGGVTEKIYNPTTNSYCEYRVEADIDGDGKFDDNDKLASDVQLYVITSRNSFSCGNMLPTNIQDNRPNNTTFIGTKSGGGACFVDGKILLGLGTMCQFSSCKHMLRGNSSYGNFITNDTGNTITSGWAISDKDNPADFFNRASINNKIWNR